jgi:hypothetical protein
VEHRRTRLYLSELKVFDRRSVGYATKDVPQAIHNCLKARRGFVVSFTQNPFLDFHAIDPA